MSEHAAIILCAGKGTRMGDATCNKVAFDCAGVPVIRRIVRNLRAGGVARMVVVVGHRAESVMAALDGEPGVLYAYQAEQRGTGHAVQCGLKVLEEIGHDGSVVVTMGDKLVSVRIVRELLARAEDGKRPLAVLGVQPREQHPNGGHVVFDGERPLGIVEHADAKRAIATGRPVTLADRTFTGDEILFAPYVNTAFYCFDAAALGRELRKLRTDNAQGEIYLTDTIAVFAAAGALEVYRIDNPADMLTYSTRPELRAIAQRFLRPADELLAVAAVRESAKASALLSRLGNRPCILASAPGRVNLMGRHVEHRGGSVNVVATAERMVFAVSPRGDDVVTLRNLDSAFPPAEFSISRLLPEAWRAEVKGFRATTTAEWLDFLKRPEIVGDLESSRGHWVNYVKGAVLRFQMATEMPLCGMDILAIGDIPVAAGLSSSSAIVVAAAESLCALNALNVPVGDFVDLCGEGEWYVGSRGGQGDHAASKCSRRGRVTHLRFKPFAVGETVPFPDSIALLVVESGEQAKKSEGAREVFNARIRDYETAFNDVKRHFPELPIVYFRDLAFLPEADRRRALSVLAGTVRGVAEFGVDECRRAEACLEPLRRGDFVGLGEMMKESHDGDRVGRGGYECSTPRIDALCDRLNAMDGVYGSQLAGAGLGGCVIALVDERQVASVAKTLGADGYRTLVCRPSDGSSVVW